MKSAFFHLGVVMSLVTLAFGIRERYDMQTLILKALAVLFIWTFTAIFVQKIIKSMITVPDADGEENDNDKLQDIETDDVPELEDIDDIISPAQADLADDELEA